MKEWQVRRSFLLHFLSSLNVFTFVILSVFVHTTHILDAIFFFQSHGKRSLHILKRESYEFVMEFVMTLDFPRHFMSIHRRR